MEEIWSIIQIIAAGIVLLGSAGGVVVTLYRYAKKPNDSQNARLDKHDQLLDNDNQRLKALEAWRAEKTDGEKVIMRALYALLQHSIDGNHTEKLEKSMTELEGYIFNK